MKLIKCTECGGEGNQLHVIGTPYGPSEYWEVCEYCDGEGEMEVEE